jgi:hypothetical protein
MQKSSTVKLRPFGNVSGRAIISMGSTALSQVRSIIDPDKEHHRLDYSPLALKGTDVPMGFVPLSDFLLESPYSDARRQSLDAIFGGGDDIGF